MNQSNNLPKNSIKKEYVEYVDDQT